MAANTKRLWKVQEFKAHSANVNCLALGQKSGRVLVTGGDDKKVNLWAIGKNNCIMSLNGHITSVETVRFNHTEELVAAGSAGGVLKIWDLEATKIMRTLTGHRSGLRAVDFHPYGDFLTSASLDSSVKVWDVRRKGCIFTYKGHSQSVNSVKFSPDGLWVASGGEEGWGYGLPPIEIPEEEFRAQISGHVPKEDVEANTEPASPIKAGRERGTTYV
ncbi:katanin p80 WD40 repeat-containing subunit B1-like [Homalodisca vitripennis]|uniref:katanin p80 WD40 repeat-containing subunit B1-like n=1 Tax=Homalodisca vitripennis TaxID=197043 RepID=UPI001EEAE170|nr:katanin p80 WD40 repeat-containing subunit B1-like [Homalodisca vitripennis]